MVAVDGTRSAYVYPPGGVGFTNGDPMPWSELRLQLEQGLTAFISSGTHKDVAPGAVSSSCLARAMCQ
eukprot:gene7499-7016_t